MLECLFKVQINSELLECGFLCSLCDLAFSIIACASTSTCIEGPTHTLTNTRSHTHAHTHTRTDTLTLIHKHYSQTIGLSDTFIKDQVYR